MARLSKKLKQEWDFLSVPKQAEEHTTTCAANAVKTVNKVSEQSLFVVLCIVPKEVSNRHQTATISTIRDKRITDIQFKIKRLTEKKFDDFGTFLIQKNGCCNYHFRSPFKPIQPTGNRINI